MKIKDNEKFKFTEEEISMIISEDNHIPPNEDNNEIDIILNNDMDNSIKNKKKGELKDYENNFIKIETTNRVIYKMYLDNKLVNINDKIEKILKDITIYGKKINFLVKENKQLKERVSEMEEKLKDIEEKTKENIFINKKIKELNNDNSLKLKLKDNNIKEKENIEKLNKNLDEIMDLDLSESNIENKSTDIKSSKITKKKTKNNNDLKYRKYYVFKTKKREKITLFFQNYNTDPTVEDYIGFEDTKQNKDNDYYIYLLFNDRRYFNIKTLKEMEYIKINKNAKNALEYLKNNYKIIFWPKEIIKKRSYNVNGDVNNINNNKNK